MAPKIDSAILKALSLDSANTSIASHGGSGFVSTFKITSKGSDARGKVVFRQTREKLKEVKLCLLANFLILSFNLFI